MDKDYPLTAEEGKVTTINTYLRPRYGADPLLVAGDSLGDYNMLTEYSGTACSLLYNRCKGGKLKALSETAIEEDGQERPRYVLQGRDENRGEFLANEGSILLGESDITLLGS